MEIRNDSMILKLEHVSKSFGDKQVLNDINLDIQVPQIIGLVAPNGYGKTTLFNIISNLEKYDSGKISVFSKDNRDEEIFNHLAYLQDNRILYDSLTAREHLSFVAHCHNVKSQKITDVCDKLKISSYLDKRVKHYSLGMKQHLLLAIALVSEPKLLILDEPLNGLDPSSVKLFREIMMDLLKSGVTIIISSHNLYEIEKLTSTVLFLHNCQIIKSSEIDVSVEYLYILENICAIEDELVESNFTWTKQNSIEFCFVFDDFQKEKFETICHTNNVKIYDCIQKTSKIESAYFSLFS